MRRVRRCPLSVIGAALTTCLLAPAAGASPSARLALARGVGAEKCPDESFFRKAVVARLGYDPFFPWARKAVIVEVSGQGAWLRARAQILDEGGVVLGERSLQSRSGDCAELMTAMGLTVSIALDDLDQAAAEAPAASEPAPGRDAPIAPAAERPEGHVAPAGTRPSVPAPARPPQLTVALGGTGSAGIGPAPTVGATAEAGLRGARWSATAEGRVDADSTGYVGGPVRVRAQTSGAALVGCAHFAGLFVCGEAQGLALRTNAEGNAVLGHSAAAWLVTLGVRAGVEVPIGGRYFVSGSARLEMETSRPRVALAGRVVYELPLLLGALGLSVGVRLF
jgi:hypothetical protein